MKRINVLLISILFSIYQSNAQSNYYLGYQEGFKYGCQCMDLPEKNVALYNGSYDQGYLDGKVDGLIYTRNKTNNSTNNQYNHTKPRQYNQPVYTPDFDVIERSLIARQSKYNSNLEKVENLILSIKETIQLIRDKSANYTVKNKFPALFILENAFYKDLNKIYSANLDYSVSYNTNQVISILSIHSDELYNLVSEIKIESELTTNRINQLLSLYNSFSDKNVTVKNGWHLVYATNQRDFCEIRRVYVVDNRIKKYVSEGAQYRVWDSDNIEFSNQVTNCKSTIKLKTNDNFIDVFFINVLSDPNIIAEPPAATGQVSFWTNYNEEIIQVFIENQHVGTINSSFSGSTPDCGESGTVVFINKAGTYNYIAVSEKYRWSGTVTVNTNDCGSKKLTQ